MDIRITVVIPQHVYQQARRVAAREHSTVDDILKEALIEAFPAVHVHPQRAQMEAEQASFEAQKQQLLGEYEGRYIAMLNGDVIDTDADKVKLAARIDEKYPDAVVLIRLVSREPEWELVMRSPRLIR